jgi:predicted amidophosphoribosyltransferase
MASVPVASQPLANVALMGSHVARELFGGRGCVSCGTSGAALCLGCYPAPRLGRELPCPPADRVIAAWDYAGPPRALVLDLKLRGRMQSATPLIDGLCACAWRSGVVAEAVTWVPGGCKGVRLRGFDHAEVLARGVARRLGLPARRILAGRSTRRDQTALGAAERRSNLADAFAARPCRGRWLLVDDVITTGATARACARALRKSGAAGVEVLVSCRA